MNTKLLAVLPVVLLGACIKTAAREKSQECKVNLKMAFISAVAFRYEHEKGPHSPFIHEIGFAPERGNRYAYFLAEAPRMQERRTATVTSAPDEAGVEADVFKFGKPASVTWAQMPKRYAGGVQVGTEGTCPECSFTFACGAQLDGDPQLDVWSISSKDRVTSTGYVISAGEPFHDEWDYEPRPWWRSW
jgi:type IV pilus assembly protein PilA